MDMLNGAGKNGSHIQELDFVAGGVAHLGNGIQEDNFLDGAGLNALVSGAGEYTVGCAGVLMLPTRML